MAMLKTAVQFLSNPNPYVSRKAERELGWTPVLAPRDAVERTGVDLFFAVFVREEDKDRMMLATFLTRAAEF